jgi:FkbM family methyltransferase
MFEFQGIWLPDGEKHFPDWMTKNGEIVDGRGTYQLKKWRACEEHIKNWCTAVDVGAHVGFWSLRMSQRFQIVEAFEPVEEFQACWHRNMGYTDDDAGIYVTDGGIAMLHECALGSKPGRVSMTIPGFSEGGRDTGGTHVGGEGTIELRTLDSFELRGVDFIKIDCEGYEHHVIEGARETILRCKPCIIVEQKPHKLGPNFGIKGTPAVDLLKSWGYKVVREIGGDFILTHG